MKKNLTYSIATVATAVLAFTTLIATSTPNPQTGGTSILHFFVRKTMTNTGVISNATGRVEANQNKQGNANIQRLDVVARSLEINTPYRLLARLGDDTNLTQITEFTTDRAGNAALRYRRADAGNNSKPGNLGKGKSPLHDALNPISNIREVTIANATTQAVLTADLTAPDKLQYLIKRTLTNDGFDADATGSLRIKANNNQTQFRLLVTGLNPGANYLLALNGSVTETNTTDATGVLKLTTLLTNPLEILDLRTVAVWDSASNSVLSTVLP